jgi:hypothetical protein
MGYLMLAVLTRLVLDQVQGMRQATTRITLEQAMRLAPEQLPAGCSARIVPHAICAVPLVADGCTPSGVTMDLPVMVCHDGTD